jgi:hypothetical protein
MYLIDTNVISEARKGANANRGVIAFLRKTGASGDPLYLSAVSIGELRRGVELIRRRGDTEQAERLEACWRPLWVRSAKEYSTSTPMLRRSGAASESPTRAARSTNRSPAIALVNGLTLVTRNMADFDGLGVELANPFD